MSDKVRTEAFKAVKRILNGSFSNLVLPKDLQGIHRAFAENIILGTIERKITLEFILSKMVQREPQEDLKALLITGIYQIIYMDRVPDSAVCDETVSIAKEMFGNKASGFVNGVLRNICRNKDNIIAEVENAEGYVKFSANKELYALIESQYPDRAEDIFGSFLGKKTLFLRVNTLKTDADSLSDAVGGSVINEQCVAVDNLSKAMENIDNGECFVQGRASQEAVKLLDARKGDFVIDACACPGGKSIGAAIDMKNEGKIYSLDLHENKLPLIAKTAEKLGITIIETARHDARKAREDLIGKADKVICDVPCSGTGVMGSKPEIKYKSPEDFKRLYPTQKMILDSASKYLKAGGTIVYSTCSINKAENEDIVKDFLSENKNFTLISQKTCLPFDEECEGFYMAKIIREK